MVNWKSRAYGLVFRRLGVPTATTRPYAVPGAARIYRSRWDLLLARAPTLDAEEHARRTGIGEIEEVAHCPLCRDRRVQPLLRPGGSSDGGWRYHVVRCPSCGLLYRNPGVRPERLGELYARGYSKFLSGEYAKRRRDRYVHVMDGFAPVFEDGRGRRLLDFGCGTGSFLELAAERGFEGYGVDLSPDSIEAARKRPSGRHAYVGRPDEIPEIAGRVFDVVTMWSVLAHLPRPIDDLRMLRKLLAPDGVLLILTVNANSLLLKARRAGWNGFTRNHLAFYSPVTLPRLLRSAGFKALVMPPMPGEHLESGTIRLSRGMERRYRRAVDDDNQGNMLRALVFNDPDGPRRWGMHASAVRL